MAKKAIVLLSGGLDSTVVLASALANQRICYTLSFNYGQKHQQEILAAKNIADYYHVSNHVISIDPNIFSSSSLISFQSVPKAEYSYDLIDQNIPTTYVPGRNTLFLSYALSFCELYEADEIYFGPNIADTVSNYPDCKPNYLKAFQQLMNLATKQAVEGSPPQLITPLLHLNKKGIIQLGRKLHAPLDLSWSCYSPLENLPCKQCLPCLLNQEAFQDLEKENQNF